MLGLSLLGLYLIVACLWLFFWRSLFSRPWWVKVSTQSPACTYYFGPFDSSVEARGHQNFYLDDLKQEGAKGIKWTIERAIPKELTIFKE
jgi:hypothetical protein